MEKLKDDMLAQTGGGTDSYWDAVYRIDQNRCITCGTCTANCPVEAISYDPCVIDEDRCILCGICRDVCPTNAVSRS